MEQQHAQRRQADGFSFAKVKENVVGLLFVTTVMGVVGFVIGTRERANDLDVQHRKILIELREVLNRHEFRIEHLEKYYEDEATFTLGIGQDLRRECSVLQNDVEHWISKIIENAQGIKEVRAECRNLITKTWENLNHDRN